MNESGLWKRETMTDYVNYEPFDRYEIGFNLMLGYVLGIKDTTRRSIRIEFLYEKYLKMKEDNVMPAFCEGALNCLTELDQGNTPEAYEDFIFPEKEYDPQRD